MLDISRASRRFGSSQPMCRRRRSRLWTCCQSSTSESPCSGRTRCCTGPWSSLCHWWPGTWKTWSCTGPGCCKWWWTTRSMWYQVTDSCSLFKLPTEQTLRIMMSCSEVLKCLFIITSACLLVGDKNEILDYSELDNHTLLLIRR